MLLDDSLVALGQLPIDSNGLFTTTIPQPRITDPGTYTLTIIGSVDLRTTTVRNTTTFIYIVPSTETTENNTTNTTNTTTIITTTVTETVTTTVKEIETQTTTVTETETITTISEHTTIVATTITTPAPLQEKIIYLVVGLLVDATLVYVVRIISGK